MKGDLKHAIRDLAFSTPKSDHMVYRRCDARTCSGSLPQSGGAFEVTNSVFAGGGGGGGESRRIRVSCVLSWTYALTDNLLRKKWDLLEDFFPDAN